MWNQSEPCSQLSAILEIVGFTNGRNQRAGGNRANTGILPIRWQRDFADSTAQSAFVECSDDIEQVRHVVL